MARADFTLPNGTKIAIDGSAEDIALILQQSAGLGGAPSESKKPKYSEPGAGSASKSHEESDLEGDGEPDIAAIVAKIKDCNEAETIEGKVLDQRDAMNRVLLCLWAVSKYFGGTVGLTSGDVERITEQLGVKVATANASTILSGRAKSYVTGDSVRKRGSAVHYKLNRRGLQHFEEVLAG